MNSQPTQVKQNIQFEKATETENHPTTASHCLVSLSKSPLRLTDLLTDSWRCWLVFSLSGVAPADQPGDVLIITWNLCINAKLWLSYKLNNIFARWIGMKCLLG